MNKPKKDLRKSRVMDKFNRIFGEEKGIDNKLVKDIIDMDEQSNKLLEVHNSLNSDLNKKLDKTLNMLNKLSDCVNYLVSESSKKLGD